MRHTSLSTLLKTRVQLLALASTILTVSAPNVFGQDTAALQREIDELKARVAGLEEQNSKLKAELDSCLAAQGPAAGKSNAPAVTARSDKPSADTDRAGASGLSGVYGGFSGSRTYRVTFMDGHALEIVSPTTGETLMGTYKIEGKTVLGDLGSEKVFYQIIDGQTLRTTWEGSPVQLKKRR